MACGITNPTECVAQGVSDGIEKMAETFKYGADWAVKSLSTAWLNAPSPDLTSAGSVTVWLQAHLAYMVVASAFASILVAAWRMATTADAQHAGELAHSLVKLVLVAGLATTLTAAAVEIGDAFAAWLLDQADVNLSTAVLLTGVTNAGVVILLAVVVILAQVIQLGIMLVRIAMIVVLAGVLPLAASASNTQMGRQWWMKSVAWLTAFVLYKPVAALIYAAAFKMSDASQDIATQLSGIFFMILAVVALPGLMRATVPATSAMSGGNAGAMAAAGIGAAIATGVTLATGGAAAVAGGGAAAAGGGFSGGAAATATAAPTGGATGGTATGATTGGAGAPAASSTGPGASGGPSGGADGAPGLSGGDQSPEAAGSSSPAGQASAPTSGGSSGQAAALLNAASSGMNIARGATDNASGAVGDES